MWAHMKQGIAKKTRTKSNVDLVEVLQISQCRYKLMVNILSTHPPVFRWVNAIMQCKL